ncbi:MAG: hypothetical protein U1E53_32130 [Dongiaceae bacterium]
MATHAIDTHKRGLMARIGHGVLHEIRLALPPTIFFLIGFNLILLTTRLLLENYLVQLAGFMVATVSALVVGKAVLVADKMPFLRRFDGAPLAAPILFKSVIYTLFVMLARLIEAFAHYASAGGAVGHGEFIEHVVGEFSWHHFVAVQLWIFVLFLIYCTASEINQLLGDGELVKIFFVRRSSKLKATRRARIRLLVRLARLTEAHGVEELRDPGTAPHRELVGILRNLASRDHVH